MPETVSKPLAALLPGELRITEILRPHWKALSIALAAVLGETLADIGGP